MAVRFLPPPEERITAPREERANLAEVIDLRSRLVPSSESQTETSDILAGPGGADELERGDAGASDTPGNAEEGRSEVVVYFSDIDESAEAREPGDESPTVPVLTAAIKLLARRALSSGELQQLLVAAGYPDLDAEQAVAECEGALYLNDDDLARSVTRKLRDSKGASRSNIRQKLRERCLPPAAIESAISELDDDEEHALIRQTANDRARRMTGFDRQTAERRLLGFLARRGWAGEAASRAAREALDNAGVARAGAAGSSVRFR